MNSNFYIQVSPTQRAEALIPQMDKTVSFQRSAHEQPEILHFEVELALIVNEFFSIFKSLQSEKLAQNRKRKMT